MNHQYNMRSQVLTLLCLYGVGLSVVRSDFLSSCPQPCTCKWSSGLRRADCSNADFTTIPSFHASGSDQTVQVLVMDGNYIKELPKNIFYSAGLSDVRKISLKNCQIEDIHRDAFSKLNILTEINLEGNQINKIEVKTFDGNNNLEKIVLSRNNIPVLREYQFPPLKSLKKIDLSDSGLEEVSSKAFNNLQNVEEIDFSGNRLQMLDDVTFLQLNKLKKLDLRDNLWICDCRLKSFRDFTIHRNLYTGTPKCSEPERLTGKTWDTTNSLQFACKPDIKVQSEMVYAESGWNITLSCHITGNPVPSMRWVLGGRVIHGNTSRVNQPGHQYHVEDIALGPGGIERNFSLVINNVQWDDQGDYNCVAINQGGMAEKNITLTFSHPTTWADISDPSSLPFILAVVGSFVLFILIVLLFCCLCRRGRNKKKKSLGQNENLMSSYTDPAGEKLLHSQTTRFEDGEGMSMTNSGDSGNLSMGATYPDLIQNRMPILSPGGESFYSGGGPPGYPGGHLAALPPLPPHAHHLHHSQEFLNPVHLMPVRSHHHMHPHESGTLPSPFHRTATLPHNYTMTGTLPHHPRSVSCDHSNGPAAPRPGYVTLPRRPRTSVPAAAYGVIGGARADGAPSPAFSYGGTAEHRDPIYDGVGPRTSADGSSKLSLNHSQGDGTPRGHPSTGSRPPGSISYQLPPPIDEAPEIKHKPKQDADLLSTATSQQTLLDGLEENLAAYDEPWGAAVPPAAAQAPESSDSSSTLEDTAKLNQHVNKDHEDPVMCSTPKSVGEDSVVVPPKTKPKTWKKPSANLPPHPLSGDGDSSQQPLLSGIDSSQQQLSVCTAYSPKLSTSSRQDQLSPARNQMSSSSAEHSPRPQLSQQQQQLLSPASSSIASSSQLSSAEHSPRGMSDNVPIWTQQQQRKVGKVRPQPPPKPKLSLNADTGVPFVAHRATVGTIGDGPASSAANSFQDETNDGSEV